MVDALRVWTCPCGLVTIEIEADVPVHSVPHFHCRSCGGCVGPVPTSAEVAARQQAQ